MWARIRREEDPDYRVLEIAKCKEWHSRHPDYRFNYYLKKTYGITKLQWDGLWAQQNGICPICNKPLNALTRVDHDHATGAVRGLLHNFCNQSIVGLYEKYPQLFEAAVNYLEKGANHVRIA